jgi:hypothetical protein
MAENWVKVARDLGYTDEKSMWIDLYTTQHFSIEELHRRLNYGMHTIIRRLEHCKIDRRPTGGARYSPNQRAKLFHLDQRVVWTTTIKELSILLNISTALISKYRNFYEGEFNELRDYMSHRGTGEICNPLQNPLGVNTD